MQNIFSTITIVLLAIIVIGIGNTVRKLKKEVAMLREQFHRLNDAWNFLTYENAKTYIKEIGKKVKPDTEDIMMQQKAEAIIKKYEEIYEIKR